MDVDLIVTSFPKLLSASLVTLKLLSSSLFIGLFIGVFFQPFVGALTDKINKRNLIIIFLIFHLIWPILLNNFISNLPIIYFSVIIWGIASISLYTITLAYLGERIKVAELSIATSVFIIGIVISPI